MWWLVLDHLLTYHDGHVAHTLKGVVHASICHFYQNLLDGLAVILWVDHICGSKLSSDLKLIRVEVNSNNPGCSRCLTAHNGCKAQCSQAEHSAR